MNLQNLFRSYCAPLFHPLAQAFVLNEKRRFFILCTPLWLFVTGTTWAVRTHFFFWDTVQLGSQHAHFFYENGFSTFLLPDNMDSGHPPIFGFYLAIAWRVFGKTLTVSHLAMLPFLLGIVGQAFKLGEKFLGAWQAIFFPLVLICNPVMASQGVLVSPDVVLVFFFLMGLNNIIKRSHKKVYWGLSIAILGLSMISMRGMMVCAVLFLFDMFYNRSSEFIRRPRSWRINSPLQWMAIRPYILGGMSALSFLLFHYFKKGWVGYHVNSEWAEAFQIVNFQGFIKNIAILVWRLVDFGHVFIGLIILFCCFLLRGYLRFKKTKTLVVLLGISVIVLTPTLLLYKGLLAHRYLLPIYLIINLLCLKLISDLKAGTWQPLLYTMAFIGLLSGNFWVYPQPISTGWDSTLAHLPYYGLRNEMIQYIDNQGIKHKEVGTAFPNLRPFKLIDLNENSTNSDRSAAGENNFSPIDFEKNQYIFYSNVMNDFNKKELAILEKDWQVVKKMAYVNPCGRADLIEVILYTRK